MGKIKKALFLGGIMGAGLAWLTSTKKGKEVRDSLLDESAALYEDVKQKILNSKLAKKISKSDYTKMVEEAVEKYSRGKKMISPLKALIVHMILSQWDMLREEINSIKNEVAVKKAVKKSIKKITKRAEKK